MSSTLLPFLYQTRTLQRGYGVSIARSFLRAKHSAPNTRASDNQAVPFEWDHDSQPDALGGGPESLSTITPSESEVFRAIFDEIALGKMAGSKKKNKPELSLDDPVSAAMARGAHGRQPMAQSMVEQARLTDFREKTLQRFPASLRQAAQVALGQYTSEPGDAEGEASRMQVEDARRTLELKARYEKIRDQERRRVVGLMEGCKSDVDLWRIMEREVFSLPEQLGIARSKKKGRDMKKKKQAKTKDSNTDEHGMDVYGPLYSHFINHGLELFDTRFSRSSFYAFKILPRVKQLGLPSYVLGVSTPFFTKLAWMFWNRFGDPNAVLEVLQEMIQVGLYADHGTVALLRKIRDDIDACTWGSQGPFVMAMMESQPYDGALMARLEDVEKYARHSLTQA